MGCEAYLERKLWASKITHDLSLSVSILLSHKREHSCTSWDSEVPDRLQSSVCWCQGLFTHLLWQTREKKRLKESKSLAYNEKIGRFGDKKVIYRIEQRGKATFHKTIRLVFIKPNTLRGVHAMRLLGWFNIHHLQGIHSAAPTKILYLPPSILYPNCFSR